MPKFSILVTDYDKHVKRDDAERGLMSLGLQFFKDYEILICHDGPKEKPYEEEFDLKSLGIQPIIINTEVRNNDWGHSSRDIMLKRCSGDWIIHFNIDNILYPMALERINETIISSIGEITDMDYGADQFSIIFYIKHWKIRKDGSAFKGLPPKLMNIDLLQLVSSRSNWESIGFWYDKKERSDGVLYEELTNKYPFVVLPEILGENF